MAAVPTYHHNITGTTQPPILWPRLFTRGCKGRIVRVTFHKYLLLKSRTHGTVPLFLYSLVILHSMVFSDKASDGAKTSQSV